MIPDTIKHLGAEFHHAAEGVGEALLLLEHARADRLAFLRQCSKDSTARLAALKEEVRALPEQIAKCDAEAARLESQTAEDLLRQALEPARKCDGDHKGPLCADRQCWLRCPDCGQGEHFPAACGAVVLHPQPPGEVIEAPLTQPKPEPFRPGLPPERLRKVWAEWEDDEGDVVTFKDEHYHWSNWRASMPVKRIHDFAWSGLRLKPLGTSWSRVEAMADATEKPTLLDLTKLPPGTVCEAEATVFSENLSLQMPTGTRFVIKEHASDGDALVESLDARQMWVRRLQPARVVKEGGER